VIQNSTTTSQAACPFPRIRGGDPSMLE